MRLQNALLLLSFLPAKSAFCQSAPKARDTIFLLRASGSKGGNRVYIEPTLNTDARKRLFRFSLTAFEREILQSNQEAALSGAPARASDCLPAAQNRHRLAPNWLPVYLYKGRYHLYAPCDAGNAAPIMIQPRYLLRFYADDPGVELLQSITKTDSKTYKLVTYTCGPEGRDPSTVYIHLLHKRGQLAVWEYAGAPEGVRYELRATPAGSAAFPIVVNECPLEKSPEWDGFDVIDFQKLLAGRP